MNSEKTKEKKRNGMARWAAETRVVNFLTERETSCRPVGNDILYTSGRSMLTSREDRKRRHCQDIAKSLFKGKMLFSVFHAIGVCEKLPGGSEANIAASNTV